ncbi:MAG: hypothetical protein Fur005_39570 [Roseiflexaceae bacterium]
MGRKQLLGHGDTCAAAHSLAEQLINWRVGNVSYNIAHTLAIPLVISGIALVTGSELGQQVALIWLAHIGMDRMVGYYFKNPFGERGAH